MSKWINMNTYNAAVLIKRNYILMDIYKICVDLLFSFQNIYCILGILYVRYMLFKLTIPRFLGVVIVLNQKCLVRYLV